MSSGLFKNLFPLNYRVSLLTCAVLMSFMTPLKALPVGENEEGFTTTFRVSSSVNDSARKTNIRKKTHPALKCLSEDQLQVIRTHLPRIQEIGEDDLVMTGAVSLMMEGTSYFFSLLTPEKIRVLAPVINAGLDSGRYRKCKIYAGDTFDDLLPLARYSAEEIEACLDTEVIRRFINKEGVRTLINLAQRTLEEMIEFAQVLDTLSQKTGRSHFELSMVFAQDPELVPALQLYSSLEGTWLEDEIKSLCEPSVCSLFHRLSLERVEQILMLSPPPEGLTDKQRGFETVAGVKDFLVKGLLQPCEITEYYSSLRTFLKRLEEIGLHRVQLSSNEKEYLRKLTPPRLEIFSEHFDRFFPALAEEDSLPNSEDLGQRLFPDSELSFSCWKLIDTFSEMFDDPLTLTLYLEHWDTLFRGLLEIYLKGYNHLNPRLCKTHLYPDCTILSSELLSTLAHQPELLLGDSQLSLYELIALSCLEPGTVKKFVDALPKLLTSYQNQIRQMQQKRPGKRRETKVWEAVFQNRGWIDELNRVWGGIAPFLNNFNCTGWGSKIEHLEGAIVQVVNFVKEVPYKRYRPSFIFYISFLTSTKGQREYLQEAAPTLHEGTEGLDSSWIEYTFNRIESASEVNAFGRRLKECVDCLRQGSVQVDIFTLRELVYIFRQGSDFIQVPPDILQGPLVAGEGNPRWEGKWFYSKPSAFQALHENYSALFERGNPYNLKEKLAFFATCSPEQIRDFASAHLRLAERESQGKPYDLIENSATHTQLIQVELSTDVGDFVVVSGSDG